MTSRIGKRTTAILAFVALALSVIVPLSVPKAFSAPDCHKAEVGDYQAKIDKVVTDFTAEIKNKGSYGYRVHNGRVYSPALDSIVPGFGEGRQIDLIIEGSKYSLADVLGEGADKKMMSGLIRNEDGTTTSDATVNIDSPKKTVDESKLKEIITGELAEFLEKNPQKICEGGNDTKPGDNPKPGCKKAEVKDYEAGIEKVVDEIEASKHQERVTGKTESENGASSFLTVFYVYEWNTAILRHVNPAITDKLILTEEQTKQVFGDGAKLALTAVGKPAVKDEQGNISYPGVGYETFHAEWVEKFDREAMTKIITDKVSEFLAKNPQEICEEGTDPKPSTTQPTKPGTDEPTTEPTGPGTDGPTTDPTKPDTDEPTKPGSSSATDSGNKPASGAATNPEGEQTVLEGATEAGALATTGAVGLIALGMAVLLVGAGAALAIRRRKHNV